MISVLRSFSRRRARHRRARVRQDDAMILNCAPGVPRLETANRVIAAPRPTAGTSA